MRVEDIGFWQHIAEDLSGKGQLRLIVQPLVALVIGARLGMADAHEGKQPIVARIFAATRPFQVVKEAVADVLVPYILAVVLDGVLQYYTLGRVRPLAALVVGALLVWLPYAIGRGFANRIMTHAKRDERRDVHA